MANRIQLRRDHSTNWTRINPILSDGEPGLEIDTNKVKYGDGTTAWRDLRYAGPGFQYARIQEGDSFGHPVTSITGIPGDVLSITSDNFAQLMWVPDTNTITLDDINVGPANFSWVFVDDKGFTVENKQPGSDFVWGFGFDGTTQFPHYTFPAADGSANQVLKTDGNGTLSWTTMSGSGTANGWQLTSSTAIVSLSADGTLTLSSSSNVLYTTTNALIKSISNIQISAGDDVGSNWIFGGDGELYLPTGGRIGATKGGTMLDAGNGYNTSLTSFYPSGMFSSCVTAVADGSLYISTYGDGTGMGGQWTFGADGSTTFPNDTILGTGTDPNVYIETVNSGTTSTWTFGTNGVLTLPAATPVIQGNGTGTDVTIIATTGTNTSTWVFGAIGNLTLPNNAGQINTSDNNVDIFATNQRGRVILTGATHAGYDGGRVVINGGNGADNSTNSREGGQIEITGGQGVNGGVGGTINIGTYNASNDENNWLFDTDGSLTLPGAINNSTKTTTGSGDPAYPTAIDLTKTVNKLADNLGSTYTLADGHEGQIMYLVPQTGATMTGVNVTVNHARIIDNSTSTALVVTDALLAPFNCSATPVPTMGVTTLIFTDSAWQADAGVWTY